MNGLYKSLVFDHLDWRLKAVYFLMMIFMGGLVFVASSIRSTVASYLRLDKIF